MITNPENIFKDIKTDDVIYDSDGDKRIVLARIDDVVFLGYEAGRGKTKFLRALSNVITIDELEEYNFTPTTDAQEVTMEEVCEKFGHNVKIKKS